MLKNRKIFENLRKVQENSEYFGKIRKNSEKIRNIQKNSEKNQKKSEILGENIAGKEKL